MRLFLLSILCALFAPTVGAGGVVHEVGSFNNFFLPDQLTIQVGDSVRWSNSTGVGHNVVSCTRTEPGCDAESAQESFSSGFPTGFWSYTHQFTALGENPYVCQPHAVVGMTGRIVVVGPPPAVPDGAAAGEPMKVDRVGDALELSWDTATCGGEGYHLLYGAGDDLPSSQGGAYGLRGFVCATNPPLPWLWNESPEPDPLIWFVVVPDDASGLEGSWGVDSSGNERGSAAPDGGSGRCGLTSKSLANSCGR